MSPFAWIKCFHRLSRKLRLALESAYDIFSRKYQKVFLYRNITVIGLLAGSANVAWSQSLVCSDFVHVNQSTANDIAEFYRASSTKYFWRYSKEIEGVQKDFLFVDNRLSDEATKCAMELEKLGYFGALSIAKGMASELGTVRRHEVLNFDFDFDFDFEVQESKSPRQQCQSIPCH
jgi:hypothetical protein